MGVVRESMTRFQYLSLGCSVLNPIDEFWGLINPRKETSRRTARAVYFTDDSTSLMDDLAQTMIHEAMASDS